MNLRSIDLNLLIVFDALMTEQNTTRAAEKLAMTQPAVSSALSRLRHITKDQLFTRTGSGMLPTTRAKQLELPIRQALNLLQSTLQESSIFEYNTARRIFNLAMTDYSEIILLPRLIDLLSWVAPNITIRVLALPNNHNSNTFNSMVNELKNGRIDLIIDKESDYQFQLINKTLLTDSWRCLIRKEHSTINQCNLNKMSIEQYLEIGHIDVNATWIDNLLSKEIGKKIKRQIILETDHYSTIPNIIANSSCIATLPDRVASIYTDQLQVRQFDTPIPFPVIKLNQYWHENIDNDTGHQWLRKLIYDLCQRI